MNYYLRRAQDILENIEVYAEDYTMEVVLLRALMASLEYSDALREDNMFAIEQIIDDMDGIPEVKH